jgi:maleylacetoacetate isomerase
MKLFTYFRSSASFRVRIALNYKGLTYDAAYVNLPKNEHAQAVFRAVNPVGLVPALELDGEVLTQSLAIIEYLDETQPGPKLLPADPLERAYVRAVAQIIACEIHPLNNLRTLRYVKRRYGEDEAGMNRWYRDWIAEGFQMLEQFLVAQARHGVFCLRDTVSLADCCLVPQVFNAERYACDLSAYPVAMGIFKRCMSEPAFIDAQPSRQGDAAP